jgi:hypothetical protein
MAVYRHGYHVQYSASSEGHSGRGGCSRFRQRLGRRRFKTYTPTLSITFRDRSTGYDQARYIAIPRTCPSNQFEEDENHQPQVKHSLVSMGSRSRPCRAPCALVSGIPFCLQHADRQSMGQTCLFRFSDGFRSTLTAVVADIIGPRHPSSQRLPLASEGPAVTRDPKVQQRSSTTPFQSKLYYHQRRGITFAMRQQRRPRLLCLR